MRRRNDGSEAMQWAVDHAGQIELSGVFELKELIDVTNGTVIHGEKK